MSDIQVPVTARVLAARINRRLAQRGSMLRKTPRHDTKPLKDFGDYFVFNVRRNHIAETHIDLEDYARKLEVLHPNECLERPPGSAAPFSRR